MRAYERFIDYAKIHTTSSETSNTHPSFAGEWDLAKLLVEQLKELGAQEVRLSEQCYVYAKFEATKGSEDAPALGLLAHMDTSPDASGENVCPILHENYDGSDIVFENGRVLSSNEFPFLKELTGETLITSDGTTLLGTDDKAGIAEIMTALERIRDEKLPHGPLRICFTPDEEIGEGTDFFDVAYFDAAFAYTVDGGDVNEVEYENFNAAGAEIVFHGKSVHPGSAKDIMINASKLAIEFQEMLPKEECPEKTEKKEGYFHLTHMEGRVGSAKLQYILRDFDKDGFEMRKQLLTECVAKINEKYGAKTAVLEMKDQYYNMLEMIEPHMHLIENAKEAIRAAGLNPVVTPVRGGTDGARISFMGLPCPNLGTGGFNFHGEYECITAERMDKAVEVVLRLIETYRTF